MSKISILKKRICCCASLIFQETGNKTDVRWVAFTDDEGLIKPKAFIVLKPGKELIEDLVSELKGNVRKIGGYKVPEEIEFVDSLPRTTLMKIDRRELRALEIRSRGE